MTAPFIPMFNPYGTSQFGPFNGPTNPVGGSPVAGGGNGGINWGQLGQTALQYLPLLLQGYGTVAGAQAENNAAALNYAAQMQRYQDLRGLALPMMQQGASPFANSILGFLGMGNMGSFGGMSAQAPDFNWQGTYNNLLGINPAGGPMPAGTPLPQPGPGYTGYPTGGGWTQPTTSDWEQLHTGGFGTLPAAGGSTASGATGLEVFRPNLMAATEAGAQPSLPALPTGMFQTNNPYAGGQLGANSLNAEWRFDPQNGPALWRTNQQGQQEMVGASLLNQFNWSWDQRQQALQQYYQHQFPGAPAEGFENWYRDNLSQALPEQFAPLSPGATGKGYQGGTPMTGPFYDPNNPGVLYGWDPGTGGQPAGGPPGMMNGWAPIDAANSGRDPRTGLPYAQDGQTPVQAQPFQPVQIGQAPTMNLSGLGQAYKYTPMQGESYNPFLVDTSLGSSDFNAGQDGLLQMMRREITPTRDATVQSNLNDIMGSGSPFNNTNLFQALNAQDQDRLDRQVAQLQGSFGSLGQRFGTMAMDREADLRRQWGNDVGARNAQIEQASYEAAQARRLQGLGLGTQREQYFSSFPLQSAQLQLQAAQAAAGNASSRQGILAQLALANQAAQNQAAQFGIGQRQAANQFNAQQGNIFNQLQLQGLGMAQQMQQAQQTGNLGILGLLAGLSVPQQMPSAWPGAIADLGALGLGFQQQQTLNDWFSRR